MAEYPPRGYPLILCMRASEPHFFLEINEETAKAKNGMETKAVNICDLTIDFGHNETHSFLKRIGKEWCCREGKIYYKRSASALQIFKK